MPKNSPGTKHPKKSLRLQQLFFRAVIFFSLIFTISLLIFMYTPLGYYLAKPLKLENVDNSQTVDALIVLDGGSYPNGQLSLFTLERLVNAIDLYHKGQTKKLIFTGNSGGFSSSNFMKQTALSLGVKEGDIILETNSYSTYDNLKNTKELLKNYDFKTVGVITNPFHLYRTMKIADKLQLDLIPFQVPDYDQHRLNSVNRLILTQYALREYFALSLYQIKKLI